MYMDTGVTNTVYVCLIYMDIGVYKDSVFIHVRNLMHEHRGLDERLTIDISVYIHV